MSTPDQHREFIDRIKRERVEQGLPPTIKDPAAYRLLDAVISGAARRLVDQAVEQGHGEKVTDPAVIRRIATIVNTDP